MRRTDYPADFQRVWIQHPVGVKFAALRAFEKQQFTKQEVDELEAYLKKRHREDQKWREGKYVPHLSTFLNQRRWEDAYKRQRDVVVSKTHRPAVIPDTDARASEAAFKEAQQKLRAMGFGRRE